MTLIPLGQSVRRTILLGSLQLSYLMINLIFYQGKWYHKLFVAGLYFFLCLFAESILWIIVTMIMTPEEAYLLDQTNWYSGEMSTYLVLVFLLVMAKGKKPIREVPAKLVLMHTSIIFMCIVISGTLAYETKTVLLILFLFLMLLIYVYLKFVEEVSRKNFTYQMDAQNHEILLKYYQQVENYQQEIRMMRHEMKNQMLRIQGDLEEENYLKIPEYLNNWFDEIPNAKHLIFIPHKSMNALLSYKYCQAKERGISCDFQVETPAILAIDEFDLTSMIGNVLDNALEACEYCSAQPFIFLRLSFKHNCLFLICENSIDGQHCSFDTRKEESEKHELGRVCIQQIVDKYDGELSESWHDHSFIIELTLFGKKQEQGLAKQT